MFVFFFLLSLFSLLALLAGMAKPTLLSRLFRGIPSRKKIALVFGILAVAFFVACVMLAPASRQSYAAAPTTAVTATTSPTGATVASTASISATVAKSAPVGTRGATGATVGVADSLSLVTEPAAGIGPILSLIQKATKSVDLVMYEMEDTQVEQALAAAQARGVAVRVLLNGGYYGKPDSPNPNAAAYAYLQSNNVPVAWSPAYFALTHEKTLVIDGSTALIMTLNLTPQYYSADRDFGIVDTKAADVSAVESIFSADWQGSKITPSNGSDLVWSPGSQGELVSIIGAAKSSLLVYNEEMNDPAITSALESAAGRGVNVEVDMTYSGSWASAFQSLTAAGVHVRTYVSSAPLYIHAKMILADGSTAFVGSENFSPTSLNNNRELGIVLSTPAIIQSLVATFQSDWAAATPFAGSSSSSGTAAPSSTSSSAAYYTSSYYTAKYYYPAACSGWQGLSPKYLHSYSTLQALLAAYPSRTLDPGCQ